MFSIIVIIITCVMSCSSRLSSALSVEQDKTKAQEELFSLEPYSIGELFCKRFLSPPETLQERDSFYYTYLALFKMKKYLDTQYIKSIRSIVKICIIISLFVTWVTVLTFEQEVKVEGTNYSRLRFHILVSVVAWCIEIMIFLILVTRLTRNQPVPWPWIHISLGIILGIFVLIASAFIGDTVRRLRDTTTNLYREDISQWEIVTKCEFIDRTDAKTTCAALDAGIVFGVVSAALLLVDVLVSIRDIRQGNYRQQPNKAIIANRLARDDMTVSSTVQS